MSDEDALLQKALAMSMETEEVNLEAMTEEEQIEYAMKMSMADQAQEARTRQFNIKSFLVIR